MGLHQSSFPLPISLPFLTPPTLKSRLLDPPLQKRLPLALYHLDQYIAARAKLRLRPLGNPAAQDEPLALDRSGRCDCVVGLVSRRGGDYARGAGVVCLSVFGSVSGRCFFSPLLSSLCACYRCWKGRLFGG